MQCPNCKKLVQPDFYACPDCGIALSLFRDLTEMKNDLERAKFESTNISDRLNRLQQKLNTFESGITKSLLKQTPEELDPKTHPGRSSRKVYVDEKRKVKAGPDKEFAKGKSPRPSSSTSERASTPPPKSAKVHSHALATSPEAEIQFGQKWLLIIGIIIMVLGIGLFLKYAFSQNWVGPAGRTSMAYLTGMAFMGIGEFFRRRHLDLFGLYLIGGGIATLYFSTFAAFQIYDLIGQVTAFGIMVLITTMAALLSLFYNTKWLVVLGFLGGFLTPILLSTGEKNQMVLMSYMTILNCGILAIAFFKKWDLLNYLGSAFTWILFSGWYMADYTDDKFWQTTMFLNIFFLIHNSAPFVYYFVKEHRKPISGFAITMPNAFISFGYSFVMIRSHFSVNYVSIVTLAYAAIFFWMASFLYRRNRESLESFVLLLAKGLVFLAITVPLVFSAQWITFFWVAQAVALLWASIRLKNNWFCGGALILLLLSTLKFFFYDYAQVFHLQSGIYYRQGYTYMVLERLFSTAAILAAFWYSGRIMTSDGKKITMKIENFPVILYSLFGGILFVTLNFEVAAFSHDYALLARFASISVLWTLFSIALMALGFIKNIHNIRMISIGLFAITIIKVFFVDMKDVSTPFRIISFIVLGLVLIGASYLYYRYRDRILPTGKIDEEKEEVIP